jgi:hypothetical protein
MKQTKRNWWVLLLTMGLFLSACDPEKEDSSTRPEADDVDVEEPMEDGDMDTSWLPDSIYKVELVDRALAFYRGEVSEDGDEEEVIVEEEETETVQDSSLRGPNGGLLVKLADQLQIELIVDTEDGVLYGFLVAADGESPVASEVVNFGIEVTGLEGSGGSLKEGFTVSMNAFQFEDEGESVHDTSQFEAQHDSFIGLSSFKGLIHGLKVDGAEYSNIQFHYTE